MRAVSDPQPYTTARRRTGLWLVLIISVLSVLAVAPALPAGWRGLSHLTSIGDGGQGELGTVTVTACRRGTLPASWTCSGHFQVNDPMAEPYPDVDGVAVQNDARFHSTGTRLDVTKALDSTHAYRWGGGRQLQTVLLWLGVLACGTAVGLAVRDLRRRRGGLPAPLAAVGVGVLLLLAAHPLW